MESKQLSVSQLAQIIGKSEKVVYNYKEGKNEPSVGVFESIIRKFPDISSYWLLTGEGSNLEKKMDTEEPTPTYISRAATQVQKTEDEIRQALAGALIEIGYLKQQVSDKEEIITLMKKI
jgi:predicted transcriptional regulator